MHLLPQSFDISDFPLLLPGTSEDWQHSSSQLSIGSDLEACRTSSRGRLLSFWGDGMSQGDRPVPVRRRSDDFFK